MLQTLMIGVRLGLRTPMLLAHRTLVSGVPKIEMLQDLWTIKSKHGMKKLPNFGAISVQDLRFKEEKSSVTKLKAHHINLDSSDSSSITNPANITPSNLTQFSCDLCGQVCKDAISLKKHLNSKCIEAIEAKLKDRPPNSIANTHGGDVLENVPTVAVSKQYACGVCGTAYTKLKSLRQHQRRRNETIAAGKADPCEFRLKKAALIEDKEGSAQEIRSCPYCKKSYISRTGFYLHLRESHIMETEVKLTDSGIPRASDSSVEAIGDIKA